MTTQTTQTRGARQGLPAKPRPGNPSGINQYTRAESPVIVESSPAPVLAPEEVTTAREALLSRAAPRAAFYDVPLSERFAFKVAEAAALCGVSESTLRDMIATGEIHAVKMGAHGKGDLRIGREELLRFFAPPPAPETAPEAIPAPCGPAPQTRASPSRRASALKKRQEIRLE